MSQVDITERTVEEFKDNGADEQLRLVEEFLYGTEEIERETKVAELDDGGLCITQSDQTFEQIYLSERAKIAVLSYLEDLSEDD